MASSPPKKEEVTDDFIEQFQQCARYGELDMVEAFMDAGMPPSATRTGGGGQTALHVASANGHAAVARLLLARGARASANDSGNTPLHWAVQNKHLPCVEALLAAPERCAVDVLARNGFGRSALTDAYSTGAAEFVDALLAHASAAALETDANAPADDTGAAGGGGGGGDGGDGDALGATQTCEHHFAFPVDGADTAATAAAGDGAGAGGATRIEVGPLIKVRQLASVEARPVFGADGDARADTTGIAVWASALFLARWVATDPALRAALAGARVCELGAGCGVPGFAAARYTRAARVLLTDLEARTLANLRHNASLNAATDGSGSGAATAAAAAAQQQAKGEEEIVEGVNDFECERECGFVGTYAECEAHEQACAFTSVAVAALDWSDEASWPGGAPFDALLGADLIPDGASAGLLLGAVDGLLSRDNPRAAFYYATPARFFSSSPHTHVARPPAPFCAPRFAAAAAAAFVGDDY